MAYKIIWGKYSLPDAYSCYIFHNLGIIMAFCYPLEDPRTEVFSSQISRRFRNGIIEVRINGIYWEGEN